MSALVSSYESFEVWFVTGSVSLYGPETLSVVARQSQDVARALGAAQDVPVRVVWKPVLADPEAIRRLALEANAADEVIGVVAWMHTFSPAKMWIGGLSALRKPLLHLATQANVALPWSEIDSDFMNLNQSAHGDREFGYVVSRLGVPHKTVVGHVSDPAVTKHVGSWQRAAVGRAVSQGLRVARFGDNMRYVAVTEGDKTEAERVFGVQVNTWGVGELAAAVQDASTADVDALMAEYDDLYDVAPELQAGGARRDSLRYAVAIEVGLRSFLESGGFGAFTTTFEDLGALRQLPGVAVQRLIQQGYGFGPEGDWKTAVLIRLAHVMGIGLPGGASIMEDYTYNLVPGDEQILGSHMLEVSPNLTTTKPRLEIHPLSIGNREDPVRLVFTADPGPGVVASLTDVRDRFRIVANAVDLVEPAMPLVNLPVGRAVWKPKPDFKTSVAAWLAAGAAHHTVMSTAIDIGVLRDFAEMLGVEFMAIDDATRLDEFSRELRWNDAYYRLVRGL